MNVLIVDGDQAAAQKLVQLLSDLYPSFGLIGQLDSIEASVRWLNEHPQPDLIFMDVHLSDGSSFDVFEEIQVEKPIIFTSICSQHALQAFKLNTIDYLLKPIEKTDLQQAVDKFLRLSASPNFEGYVSSTSNFQSPRFLIRFGQNFRLVDLKVAAFIYTEDKITFLVTKEGRRFPIQHSLEKLEEIADPQSFFRINRQFIVNIDSIKEMYAHSKSRVKLLLDPSAHKETIVSSERSPMFKKWLIGAEGN